MKRYIVVTLAIMMLSVINMQSVMAEGNISKMSDIINLNYLGDEVAFRAEKHGESFGKMLISNSDYQNVNAIYNAISSLSVYNEKVTDDTLYFSFVSENGICEYDSRNGFNIDTLENINKIEKYISYDEFIKVLTEEGLDEWYSPGSIPFPENIPNNPSAVTKNGIKVFIENEEVCVSVNDKMVEFDDKPFIDGNGRTQVPVRELCEFLNKKVYWYENPQRVAISTVPADLDNTNGGGAGGDSIQFVIGENKYSKNGKEFPMDTAARIINNRTYIPLRIAGEFLNYEVIWQE